MRVSTLIYLRLKYLLPRQHPFQERFQAEFRSKGDCLVPKFGRFVAIAEGAAFEGQRGVITTTSREFGELPSLPAELASGTNIATGTTIWGRSNEIPTASRTRASSLHGHGGCW